MQVEPECEIDTHKSCSRQVCLQVSTSYLQGESTVQANSGYVGGEKRVVMVNI